MSLDTHDVGHMLLDICCWIHMMLDTCYWTHMMLDTCRWTHMMLDTHVVGHMLLDTHDVGYMLLDTQSCVIIKKIRYSYNFIETITNNIYHCLFGGQVTPYFNKQFIIWLI